MKLRGGGGVSYALSLDKSSLATQNYAVNGAIWYAEHLIENTHFKKIFAFGVSGDEKHHKITPYFIDERKNLFALAEIDNFIDFNEQNIEECYLRNVLKEPTNNEKELKEILKDAAELHEALRNYGNLKDQDKPLIVSGILLALSEIKHKNFKIEDLNGDTVKTDGEKIYNAIRDNLKRANVQPEVKRDKILSQFSLIKDSAKLNLIDKTLGKTPLKYYTEFLHERLFNSFIATHSAEDYLGRFYGEFMSYSGGDGQTLGIVLTPKHITELFCDLLDLQPTDNVLDPCCGTGGFLIAAMHKMLQTAQNEQQKNNIRKNQLHGYELQPDMFTIATTNMILRGDGKSNLLNDDFLLQSPNDLGLKAFTVGMMNPPYSQAKKSGDTRLSEISFIQHLLNSLCQGGKCAVIVPQSTMTGGNSKAQKQIKEQILQNHTLEGVITLNPATFYGVGVMPCIAIFTAHEPHPANKICKFINFEDDGYKVAPHIGLIETPQAKSKKQHLLDVWFNKVEEQTKFCVKTTIEASDEWLHSFYYFNDEIPTEEDFDKTIGDYLTFEFAMIMQGREYLFTDNQSFRQPENNHRHSEPVAGEESTHQGDENE